MGQQLVASAQAIGAPLTIDDLRGFKVRFEKPLAIQWGDQNVFLPQPPASGGISVAQMLKVLDNACDTNRPAFLADASMRHHSGPVIIQHRNRVADTAWAA